MNARILFPFAIAVSLLSTSSFAQQEWEIVIDPENPTSSDLITISIPNSSCYFSSELQQNTVDKRFSINLHYLAGSTDECLANNPDAPDFSQSIGPLEPGTYRVALFIFWNTRPNGLRASKGFRVKQAPPPDVISEGGITGLFFNPENDGHYISILETDFNTLVIWNTFGHSGGPRWVYGVGDLKRGNRVVADSYINRSDGFSNGELEGLRVVPWGTMEVTLDDCAHGTFSWISNLPEFGSGEFPIERLAYSRQIGCEEID